MPQLRFTLLALCLALVQAGCGGSVSSPSAAPAAPDSRGYLFSHPIPPRLQWNENSGYCGETSFISAGLYFGQYCSQYTAREIASPGVNQSDPSSQLLLGVNDTAAARRMRLQAFAFDSATQQDTPEFLAWVKSNTLAGRVVIIGVFNNGILLGEWSGLDDGDPEYDHIVPVLGFGSEYPLQELASTYISNDFLTLSDNGLFGPSSNGVYQFLYTYKLGPFQGTRVEANSPGNLYLLRNRPKNHGIALAGVADTDGVTIPVRLQDSMDREPDIGHHSDIRPAPVPIRLTATVEISDPSVEYRLYCYDDFEKVPVAGFNAQASQANASWTIPAGSGNTFVVTVDTMSDQTHVFRAVPATAP